MPLLDKWRLRSIIGTVVRLGGFRYIGLGNSHSIREESFLCAVYGRNLTSRTDLRDGWFQYSWGAYFIKMSKLQAIFTPLLDNCVHHILTLNIESCHRLKAWLEICKMIELESLVRLTEHRQALFWHSMKIRLIFYWGWRPLWNLSAELSFVNVWL